MYTSDQSAVNNMVAPASRSNIHHSNMEVLAGQGIGNQQSINNARQASNVFSQGVLPQQQQQNRASLISQGSNIGSKQGNIKHQKSMSMHQQMSQSGYTSQLTKNQQMMNNQQQIMAQNQNGHLNRQMDHAME